MARAFVRRRMSISTTMPEPPPDTEPSAVPPMLSKANVPPLLSKKSSSMRGLLPSEAAGKKSSMRNLFGSASEAMGKKGSMRNLFSSSPTSPPARRRGSIHNLKSSVRNLFAGRSLEDDPLVITPEMPIRVRIRFPEPCESLTVCLVPRHDVGACVHLASTGHAQEDMYLVYLEEGPLTSGKGITLDLPNASFANIDSKIDSPVSGSAGYFWETIITAGVVRAPDRPCILTSC